MLILRKLKTYSVFIILNEHFLLGRLEIPIQSMHLLKSIGSKICKYKPNKNR